MSWQTARMKDHIVMAKAGDPAALAFLKKFIIGMCVDHVGDIEPPPGVFIEMAETALQWGLDEQKKNAETN